jgi:hypothetical protein
VFPVRYELNLYILLRKNSVFKGLSDLDFLYGEINPVFLKLKFSLHCVVGIVMEVPSGINLMMVK